LSDVPTVELAGRFNKNFTKFSGVSREILEAAPAS